MITRYYALETTAWGYEEHTRPHPQRVITHWRKNGKLKSVICTYTRLNSQSTIKERLAALLNRAVMPEGRVGVILSGGNIDSATMTMILNS